jgi:hypothetical protein
MYQMYSECVKRRLVMEGRNSFRRGKITGDEAVKVHPGIHVE